MQHWLQSGGRTAATQTCGRPGQADSYSPLVTPSMSRWSESIFFEGQTHFAAHLRRAMMGTMGMMRCGSHKRVGQELNV